MIYLLIGIMDHEEARKRHTGGKLLGFFYWKNNEYNMFYF
jgi:hypothetical protein